MHARFRALVDQLQPSFERLITMQPVTAATVPATAPSACIYLFSEGDNHLYVGRTRGLRNRAGQHSRPGSQDNQAVFAFKLARHATGNITADYRGAGRRKALMTNEVFLQAFIEAKARVRRMDFRFVEETDPLRQVLLELYASVVLDTPFNEFETT
jgi:predicted GIY-YIG superfamily endonuclease